MFAERVALVKKVIILVSEHYCHLIQQMRNITYYKCSDQYRTIFIWPKNKLSTLGTAKSKKAMGRNGEYNYSFISTHHLLQATQLLVMLQ